MPKAKPTIADLQDEVKAKDRRIEELRGEVDELRDLVKRMEEQVEDGGQIIEHWVEAFNMELDANGAWTCAPWVENNLAAQRKYTKLLTQWNRFVGEYNATVVPRRRNVGRPISASDAQQEQVRKLRKAGKSLRAIAEETSLGLRTVCTIVDKRAGKDRTTIKVLQRIDPDRAAALRHKSSERAIKALPRQINATLKTGRELIKEAKGLK